MGEKAAEQAWTDPAEPCGGVPRVSRGGFDATAAEAQRRTAETRRSLMPARPRSSGSAVAGSSLGCSSGQAASAYQGTGTSAGGECVVCVRYPSVEYTRSIPIRILRIAYLQIYFTVQELMGVITFSWHFFVRRYYRIIAYHYSEILFIICMGVLFVLYQ